MRMRATVSWNVRGGFVIIGDHSAATGGMSVRDDARAVVAACLQRFGLRRIIVRDSAGRWYELHHDGESHLQTVPLAPDFLARIADAFGLLV